jgi:RimJ/RimL family protein N-acetyltransferase
MALRGVAAGDHEWLVDLHNDPLVLNNVRDPRPITLQGHMAWWEGISGKSSEERLIFTVDDAPVGFTKFYSIDAYNRHCVLGADIHKQHRGLGLAKHMWSLMLQKCFDEWGLHRVALSTASYNLIGQRVYLNLGFKIEGTMRDYQHRGGKFYDAVCMYMLDTDWKEPHA